METEVALSCLSRTPGDESRKDIDTRRGCVNVAGKGEDIARETRNRADTNTEREDDTNTEEEQGGEKQAGEKIWGRDGRELKTALAEENYTETKGRVEEKQADTERSGDSEGPPASQEGRGSPRYVTACAAIWGQY
ncbi:hypothetical protein NDU88_002159 [Pleurodeles waltl]|uniref:Uncharacterized protein n=1 Tax=Pleurodeles waltl TaxID=8319 RepID=A0AAV7M2K1_PLEWA|nr:hypothetical protein NDU88_002159 [Pleurodeles waltl]